MEIIILLSSLPIALAIFIRLLRSGRVAGWMLFATGVILLGHAGITCYVIRANNNVVPSSVSFYSTFATIPAGALLVFAGGLTLLLRKWACHRETTGKAVPELPGFLRFAAIGLSLGWAAGFFGAHLATYLRFWETVKVRSELDIGEFGFPPFVWLPFITGIIGLAVGLIMSQGKRRNS
jgi:hypothetical protein